jgi:hypothetical protein
MIRYIKLANANKRDAEITFKSLNPKSAVTMGFASGEQVVNKLVFAKKYQLKHVNGLTYDFLFDMAKELAGKDALMMLAGGASGKEPLVMNDGGKPYRAFLEGRIKGDKYCLMLHLTDQELKPLPT